MTFRRDWIDWVCWQQLARNAEGELKFKVLVAACLVAIAYGVVYSNLPCWAQVMGRTMWCQVQDGSVWNLPAPAGMPRVK